MIYNKKIKNIASVIIAAAIILSCMPLGFCYDKNDAYSIISDIVYTYKELGIEGLKDINPMISDLKELDAAQGEAWEKIISYWQYVDKDMTVNYGALPKGLPDDDSLCIVVLGFALNSDGSPAPELISRLEVALNSANEYPNAYIAVTGGGTAYAAEEVTEGSVMADYLFLHDVDIDRIIIEDKSLTTAENAYNTCRIISEDYPSVKNYAVITSDYHLPIGCLVFQTQLLLSGSSASVISGAACEVKHPDSMYLSDRVQGSYVWQIYDRNRTERK